MRVHLSKQFHQIRHMYKENLMIEKLREKFVEMICEKHYDRCRQ